MPEEENPFMVKPKKAHEERKEEAFGSDELVSFMVSPNEEKKVKDRPALIKTTEGPHWESSGTPIWDKKVKKVEEEDFEVVEHE
ncbi:MAG TPA: hypothetical protein ENK47_02790 [Euryarchaeota archaeon]|nr:hypothetical protein [Euryarchaeota archaeon]